MARHVKVSGRRVNHSDLLVRGAKKSPSPVSDKDMSACWKKVRNTLESGFKRCQRTCRVTFLVGICLHSVSPGVRVRLLGRSQRLYSLPRGLSPGGLTLLERNKVVEKGVLPEPSLRSEETQR